MKKFIPVLTLIVLLIFSAQGKTDFDGGTVDVFIIRKNMSFEEKKNMLAPMGAILGFSLECSPNDMQDIEMKRVQDWLMESADTGDAAQREEAMKLFDVFSESVLEIHLGITKPLLEVHEMSGLDMEKSYEIAEMCEKSKAEYARFVLE
ncbi:MAG: hypothetical protein FWG97_00800 [Deltaproteobacteria bacterium]|nr:hypothetical protein [Deltaproteobacteria bacterium]